MMRFLFSLCLIAFLLPLQAQKSFADIAEMRDGKYRRTVLTQPAGYYWLGGLVDAGLLDKANLPEPKRIGILTIQIWDEAEWKKGINSWTKNYLTPEGNNSVATRIRDEMVPAMRNQFAAAEIELLEPAEYLTEETKSTYTDMAGQLDLKAGPFDWMIGALASLGGAGSGTSSVSADGYMLYPVTVQSVQKNKIGAQIGSLAEQLNVDALLIISLRVELEGKKLVCKGIEMAVAGSINDDKSATYDGPRSKAINIARDGTTFAWCSFNVDPIEIARLKKKEIQEWKLDGLPELAARMSEDLIVGMREMNEKARR